MKTFSCAVRTFVVLLTTQHFCLTVSAVQGALNRNDIAWLQSTFHTLAHPDTTPAALEQLERDIIQRIRVRPELANLPFTVPPTVTFTINDTQFNTTSLALVATKNASPNPEVLISAMHHGVSPLTETEFETIHNTTLALSSLELLIANAISAPHVYSNDFIRLCEYAKNEIQVNQHHKKSIEHLDSVLIDDMQGLLETFLNSEEEHDIALQIVARLHSVDITGSTILDRLIQETEANDPAPELFSPSFEAGRNQLMSYLLENRVPLSQQESLTNSYLKTVGQNLLLKGIPSVTIYGLVSMALGYAIETTNKNLADALLDLAIIVGAAQLRFRAAAAGIKIKDSFPLGLIAGYIIGKAAPAPKDLNLINSIVLMAFPMTIIKITENTVKQTCMLPIVINLIKEHMLAYKQGIIDIWGNKRAPLPLPVTEEIGGLE